MQLEKKISLHYVPLLVVQIFKENILMCSLAKFITAFNFWTGKVRLFKNYEVVKRAKVSQVLCTVTA